jgi:nicotinamidase-related amidase
MAMTRQALLVIDLLRDFLEPAGTLYCGEAARRIIPAVQGLLARHREAGSLIVFPMDCHRADDKEFEMFAPHCVAGTAGAECIPEIEVRPGELRLAKMRFSAFFRTDLERILAEAGVEEVHVSGVCTSICVMDTVSDLRSRDYMVVVHETAVADFDPEAHALALKRMKNTLGARVEP